MRDEVAGLLSKPPDANHDDLVDRALWRTLVDKGTRSTRGAGEVQGEVGSVIVAEALGRSLWEVPHVETAIALVLLGASGADESDAIARGHVMVSIGLAQCDLSTADDLRLLDAGSGDGVVTGRVRFVRFARAADRLLVRVDDGRRRRLACVPLDAAGVTRKRLDTLGGAGMYEVTLAEADVAAPGVVDDPGRTVWEDALASGRIRLAGYLVGLADGAFAETVAHVKRRRQFGRPIASFQAVAFRLAALAARLEACRLFAYYAAAAGEPGEVSRRLAAQALALASSVARAVTVEGIQLHGARGMREDALVQRYYRQAAGASVLLGTPGGLRRAAAPALLDAPERGRFAIAGGG